MYHVISIGIGDKVINFRFAEPKRYKRREEIAVSRFEIHTCISRYTDILCFIKLPSVENLHASTLYHILNAVSLLKSTINTIH